MDHLHIVAITETVGSYNQHHVHFGFTAGWVKRSARDCIVKVRQGTSRIEYISVFHLHLLLLLRKN